MGVRATAPSLKRRRPSSTMLLSFPTARGEGDAFKATRLNGLEAEYAPYGLGASIINTRSCAPSR